MTQLDCFFPTKVYSSQPILAAFPLEALLPYVAACESKAFPMICNIVSVVDDDPMVRDSLVDLLNSLGYTALGFETAENFLDSGELKITYCLITDQNLPGLSGTELQKFLRAEGFGTPVIFITGYPEPTVRERALGDGAVAFLTKPFEDTVLVDCLQSALSARQHQSEQRRF